MLLDLSEIQNPEPTKKMDAVLYNLLCYGFIDSELYCKAIDDYYLASSLIDEHQEAMHNYVAKNASHIAINRDSTYYSEGDYYMDNEDCDMWGIDASFFF